MPNPAAAQLIADRLPRGLVHPGDPDNNQPAKLIPLPGLGGTGIPPEMAQHFANEAGLPSSDVPQLIGEAIVNLIETDLDSEIVPRAELEQLRAQATALDNNPGSTISVHCRCNPREPVLRLSATRSAVTTDGRALRTRIDEVCTCE